MAKFYPHLSDAHREFIESQHIFFTATAPEAGRINLSPKGMDTFRCLDSQTVAYLDLTGSGNETAAHLRENGRLTIMFCSFNEKPIILRLYGRGKVVREADPAWQQLLVHFNPIAGQRQIIVLNVESVQTSCGFGVPVLDFVAERQMLREWAEKKGDEALKEYRRAKNMQSIDGLSAL